jgi:predicted amidohydrolase YtcJ
VSPSGKFSKVFSASSDSKLAETAHPGYAMPGLWDGHGHLLPYGEFLNSVDLFGSTSMDEIRGRVRGYVEGHPGAGSATEWIRGIGWDQMALGAMPTAVSLCCARTGRVGSAAGNLCVRLTCHIGRLDSGQGP